jgi:hypothetical protein
VAVAVDADRRVGVVDDDAETGEVGRRPRRVRDDVPCQDVLARLVDDAAAIDRGRRGPTGDAESRVATGRPGPDRGVAGCRLPRRGGLTRNGELRVDDEDGRRRDEEEDDDGDEERW